MNKPELTRHFKSRRELNETRCIYLPDPRTINTLDRLTYHGGQADRYITELTAVIETMQAYQMLVYERIQELTTAPYHTEVHLTREKRYDNKVRYHLEVKKVYDVPGINPVTTERTTYPGTERHKALADFTAYQKAHSGIIAIKDIEKAKWER